MTMNMLSKTLQTLFIITLFVMSSVASSASMQAIEIREDAPTTYTVKKGDTLWDISSLFLQQPWLWPELWRNNTQIENPHLIYPGDVLRLRFENGKPVIEVVRDKLSVSLTPGSNVRVKPEPIDILPWDLIAPYVAGGYIMTEESFNQLPMILGDRTSTPRFTSDEFVLSDAISGDDFEVVRKARILRDNNGKELGVHIDIVSQAKHVLSSGVNGDVIHITKANLEVKAGDRLMLATESVDKDLTLKAADRQKGAIVENASGNALAGQKDIVIINLGDRKVSPGTVFGIYEQGKEIERPEGDSLSVTQSIFSIAGFSETNEQPAYKVGELIVIKTFENASYALVTKTSTHLKGGEIIANP